MPRLAMCLLPVVLLALAGCGDDKGTAPTIADLTYNPTTMPVGQATTITGNFTFTDPDGDLKDMVASVTLPSGQTQTLPAQALQNEAGQTNGAATLLLMLNPPAAGTYRFEVWLTDDAGNASNHLGGTLEAQ
ncbi:MAG TPA: hypothetical protein VGQ83_13800 [Polyangia bacterium]|jgi:hypothetical protein